MQFFARLSCANAPSLNAIYFMCFLLKRNVDERAASSPGLKFQKKEERKTETENIAIFNIMQ
jgi:hypothetical protein